MSITVVVNSGDTPAQNCKIEIVPGSVQCEPSDFPLAPKQEQAVSCNYAPGRDGEVNLVAIGSWKEANALRTTGQHNRETSQSCGHHYEFEVEDES